MRKVPESERARALLIPPGERPRADFPEPAGEGPSAGVRNTRGVEQFETAAGAPGEAGRELVSTGECAPAAPSGAIPTADIAPSFDGSGPEELAGWATWHQLSVEDSRSGARKAFAAESKGQR